MLYRIVSEQIPTKPVKTTKKKISKKITEDKLENTPEVQDKDGNLIELDPGKKYKEINQEESEETIVTDQPGSVITMHHLVEIGTGKIIYSDERRIAVVQKKQKLEGWREKKFRQKWN